MAGGDEGHHNMGGNKGEVLVPHFGLNMPYEQFAELRKSVQTVMKRHGVPQDLCVSFSKMGHAPARNLLDSFHFLFADDPDTCLSMFVCDPSGNMNEIKWYLDFGEMFKEKGTLGMSDIEIDNTLVSAHFPAELLRMMEQRGLRGDQEGLEILHVEQGRPELTHPEG
jgi:extradiol dioxygenase family protein